MSEHEEASGASRHADRLTGRERRWVAAAAVGPVVLAVLVLAPVAAVTGAAGAGEVVGASVVYGGLLGLAAAFVVVDRLRARQCPACRRRPARGQRRCRCGYDLLHRPRYVCDQRHTIHFEAGVCGCGRELQALPTATGLASQVLVSLRAGGWLALFLVLAGVVIYVLEGRL